MRWPFMLTSTHESRMASMKEVRELGMRALRDRADEAEAALQAERKRHDRTLRLFCRLKADGTLQPKRAAGPVTPPAADPVGVAIEAVTAPYPRSERARLAAQQRDHAKRLAAQGFTPEQIAERLRAGSQERGTDGY